MTKVTIRYKKPQWSNWTYETVDSSSVEMYCLQLEMMGYIVERAV